MERIAESELIINSDGSVFHLHVRPEELADIVLLVGDPGRVRLIAELFDSREFIRESREFCTCTGMYKSHRMTVMSTGIGCDNIDIVMTELDALANVDFETRCPKAERKSLNIVRFGTCGAIRPDIELGTLVLSHISIGCDGLMNWYAGRELVSMPDFEEAFMKHMGWNRYLPVPYFVHASDKLVSLLEDVSYKGMTVSAPGFYGPQGRKIRLPLAIPDLLEKFESFEHDGWRITNIEMEGSAIAAMSARLGHNAVTACVAIANRYKKDSNPDYKAFVMKAAVTILDKLTEL